MSVHHLAEETVVPEGLDSLLIDNIAEFGSYRGTIHEFQPGISSVFSYPPGVCVYSLAPLYHNDVIPLTGLTLSILWIACRTWLEIISNFFEIGEERTADFPSQRSALTPLAYDILQS